MPDWRHNAVLIAIAAVSVAGLTALFAFQVHSVVDGGEIATRAQEITGGNPEAGRKAIKARGCGGCHEIPGVRGANGTVGPPLKGVAKRGYIAGVLPNSGDNMVQWILDPPGVDAKTAMPKIVDDEQEARHIAAFLYTLE
ncbi:MAG TPA: c-type cytochrome [Azospirillum sp.]|nr:c-type cytochrome [Azospirillum sp.]